MRTVRVHYQGWGENWPLGTLADDGQRVLFEYSPQALNEGLSLSPRHLPLQKQTFSEFPAHQWQLPGLFADSMPSRFTKPGTPCSAGPWIMKSAAASCGALILGRMPA